MKTVLKVLTALAAIAGVVYVIATYGDKIVAWCKDLLAACPCHNGDDVIEETEFAAEAPVEEPAAEEASAEEAPAEEVPAAEEPVADESAPVANEEDFEG